MSVPVSTNSTASPRRWQLLLAAAGTGLLLLTGSAFGQYGNQQGGMQDTEWQDDENWDEEDMQAEMGLPMTFAGKGARIVITDIDPNTGAMTGTVEFGGPKLKWTGQYPMDPNFDPSRGMTVNVATQQGRRPLKIVDESETTARLTFEGKTYRVSINGRYEKPNNGPVADDVIDEVEDGPNPPAKSGNGPGSFGVGVVPHDTMPGWRVKEIDKGSVAEMVGLQVDDIILGAVDGDGNPMAISPDKGFEAFKNVVTQWNFGLQVMREGENPPVFNVTVQRAGGAPPPEKENEDVQRADAGRRKGPASAVSDEAFARLTLKQHVLLDPGMQNMKSHTMLVPQGWDFEGQAFWAGQQAFRINPSPTFDVTGPDGTSVSLAPQLSFKDTRIGQLGMQYGMQQPQEGTAANGYPVMLMPQSEEDWRQWVTKLLVDGNPEWSNIRVEPAVDVPEITHALQQQIAPLRPMFEQMNRESAQTAQMSGMNMPGMQMRIDIDAKARGFEFNYTRDGQRMEGAILLGVTMTINQSDFMRDTLWSLAPALAFTAPEGKLEARIPTLMAIATSVQPTAQWHNMLVNHIAKMNKIDRDGARKMAQINRNHAREMSRISRESHKQRMADIDSSSDSFRRRMAMQDEGSRKFNNAILGVEDYSSDGSNTGIAGGTSISLPGGYENVYTNGNGDYILSNDVNYNPATDPAVNSQNWDTMRSLDR